jgi:hypothetical protein
MYSLILHNNFFCERELVFEINKKVKLSLCHEGVSGSRDIAPLFFTSALREWLASRLCRFNLEERALSTHWIGGWVGPRAGLYAVEKRKVLSAGNLTGTVQPVAIPTLD